METPLLDIVIERSKSGRWVRDREEIEDVASRSGGNVFPLFADGFTDSVNTNPKYAPILNHYDLGENIQAEILIENLVKDEIRRYIPSKPRDFEPKELKEVAAAFAMHFHNRELIRYMAENGIL